MAERKREVEIYLKPGSNPATVVFKAFLKPFGLIGEKKGIEFSGITALRQLLSNERARLLFTLKNKRVSSIYELAKELGRDFKSVRKDVELLKHFGFVKFIPDSKGRRERIRPELMLDRLQITVHI